MGPAVPPAGEPSQGPVPPAPHPCPRPPPLPTAPTPAHGPHPCRRAASGARREVSGPVCPPPIISPAPPADPWVVRMPHRSGTLLLPATHTLVHLSYLTALVSISSDAVDICPFLHTHPSPAQISQGHTAAAAAAAKSLQSCPTLCDPKDGSPQGSPIPWILQARTLECVAISFSSA